MSIDNRINRMERKIELNKDLFPDIPDFENWSDEKLKEYISKMNLKFHNENAIESLEDAEKKLKYYLSTGAIDKKIYDYLLKGEQYFFSQIRESDGAIIFVDKMGNKIF